MLAPLVSIIIPVYRAEKTLPACLDQLKAQSYRTLQLIFIDDCSSDGSYAYLASQREALEALGMEVTLLRHEKNQGVAVARNTGLDAAHGEYIYSVDADDRLADNAIELLVKAAEQRRVDIVGCEYSLEEGGHVRHIHQPDVKTGQEAFQQICYGRMKWNLWLFLFRRELIEKPEPLRFLPGKNMGEDLMLLGRLLDRANGVEIIHQPLYTYVRSEEQITGSYRPEHWSQVFANLEMLDFSLSSEARAYIPYLKLTLKRPLLVTGKKADYLRWTDTYRETDSFIMQNPGLPFRSKILEQMAAKRQYWYVALYYHVVMRGLYSLFYR